jgi:hypothetical protein|tara:strand:+ start:274 stop:756 length:483 start_codon:yes stop_codon:yes gene_type:complete
MKIYRNLLPKNKFLKIKNVLMSSDFSWYYNNMVNTEKDNMFQFTHNFYTDPKINSAYFNLLEPVFNTIKPLTIIRVKANLLTKNNKNIEHGFHTDYINQDKITTGILYINTNNGYTKFKNGEVVKSEENKYVEFNSNESHTGATCTDENTRVVINFNYIK